MDNIKIKLIKRGCGVRFVRRFVRSFFTPQKQHINHELQRELLRVDRRD